MNELTKDSEQLLKEIKKHIHESEYWANKFSMLNSKGNTILRGCFKELKDKQMISVQWADNIPYNIVVLKDGYLYEKMISMRSNNIDFHEHMDKCIFISHSTADSKVAELLSSYLIALGIPSDSIFCSSLPGNDVQFNIPNEIKNKLKNSVLNIAILSENYYESAYCLNESGVFWYVNTDFILISLPEITHVNMKGFLDKNNKLRNLKNELDVFFIGDTALNTMNISRPNSTILARESEKLIGEYNLFLKNRQKSDENKIDLDDFITDDVKIIIYYLLLNRMRKAKISDVKNWLHDAEVYNVNIDSAVDLIETSNSGNIKNGYIELNSDVFVKLIRNRDYLSKQFSSVIEEYTKLSSEIFLELWNNDKMDDCLKLFVAYIVDERITFFGDRWMKDEQIKSISSWESKNSIINILSENYSSCLSYFIREDFVYPSSWTEYGNVRGYTLNNSLVSLFLENCAQLLDELNRVKEDYYLDLPF